METFADYILSEKDWIKKMEIMHYLQLKTGIFFDKSVIFKTYLAKLFLENTDIDLDENLVLTACLLCNCKKGKGPQDLEKIKTYAKEGAEYLSKLGFSNRFCKICEEVNRYSGNAIREKESDVLELVDNFGGMLLDRPERIAFKVDEALVLLEYRNLKDKNNRYLQKFKQFVNEMKQPAIQVVANEINSIDTESNIPAIKAMVDLDRRIRESILEKKYDKIKEQTIKQEEAENINADSIRKDMNREFID